MKKIEKVTLIGLGAMGVFFAPRISGELGAGFRILAAGSRKDRLEQRGVTVNGINYRFPIVTPEMEGDPADLVIIAVKGYDLPQAIEDIRNQVGPHTIILSVLNGVESEKQVGAVYGMEHMLYSYMRISIVMRDGKTEFDPDRGVCHFGDIKNDPEHLSENVLAVKELFTACNIGHKVDEDMLHGIWFKFMCNVSENMTCAAFQVPYAALQNSSHAHYFRMAAVHEIIALAKAMGVTLTQKDIERQDRSIKGLNPGNRPSTLQDLEVGKHTEVEMFAGTAVRLGKELGVPTPICEMFYHGINLIEERMFGGY